MMYSVIGILAVYLTVWWSSWYFVFHVLYFPISMNVEGQREN